MRNCLVLLNVANFTGTLNHGVKLSESVYQKLRTDYKELLAFVANERNILGAYVISQKDTSKPKTEEQVRKNEAFLHSLKRFGWRIVEIEYDGRTTVPSDFVEPIWQSVLGPLTDSEGYFTVDPAETDVVIISGSSGWYDLASAISSVGLGVEIAYLKQATNKSLLTDFPFFDLTEFLIQSNENVIKKSAKKEQREPIAVSK